MSHNRALRTVAQVSVGALLSLLMSCAGTKVNTPPVEGSFGKIGGGSVEVAPETKQPDGKRKEESFDCRRCQRIADEIAENEGTLNHPATGKGWKATIRDEIRALKQQREHCLTSDCERKVSRR